MAVQGGHTFTKLNLVQNSCGLTVSGDVLCWGEGGSVFENAPTGDARAIPKATWGVKLATLSSNGDGLCGTNTAGLMYCWGNNLPYLGTGFFVNYTPSPPTLVTGGHVFTNLDVDGRAACALDESRRAWCWGDSNQLGVGTAPDGDSYTPLAVASIETFNHIALGDDHVCASTAAGAIHCWGSASYGELGMAAPAEGIFRAPVLVYSP